MTPKDARRAIRVSHAFCLWPCNATTGQVLKALNDFYDAAYEDGVAGRVAEGKEAMDKLVADMQQTMDAPTVFPVPRRPWLVKS